MKVQRIAATQNNKQKNVSFEKYLTRQNPHQMMVNLDTFVEKTVEPFVEKYSALYEHANTNLQKAEKMHNWIWHIGDNYQKLKSEPTKIRGFKIFSEVENHLARQQEYEKNNQEFKHLVKKGSFWMYANEEILQKIEEISPLFNQNDAVFANSSILSKVYKKIQMDINNGHKNATLKVINPKLAMRREVLNDAESKAMFVADTFPVASAKSFKTEAMAVIEDYNSGKISDEDFAPRLPSQFNPSLLELSHHKIRLMSEMKKSEDPKRLQIALHALAETDNIPETKSHEVKATENKIYKTILKTVSHGAVKLRNIFDANPYLHWNSANDAVADKILKAQKQANIELWHLIEKSQQTEKEAEKQAKLETNIKYQAFVADLTAQGKSIDDFPF